MGKSLVSCNKTLVLMTHGEELNRLYTLRVCIGLDGRRPRLRGGSKKGSWCTVLKASPYSITERRVPGLIPVLGSQPAGDVSHKPGGRLPLLSAKPAVTPAAPLKLRPYGAIQICLLLLLLFFLTLGRCVPEGV